MKKRFTPTQHEEMASYRDQLRKDLMALAFEKILPVYRKSAKSTKKAFKVWRAVEDLRCELDNEWYRENPSNGKSPYYGRDKHLHFPFNETDLGLGNPAPPKPETPGP